MSFATALREPAFAPRAMFLDAGSREGTRALAREILMMTPRFTPLRSGLGDQAGKVVDAQAKCVRGAWQYRG